MFARIARQYRRFFFCSSLLLTIVALGVTLNLSEWPSAQNGLLITVLAWIIMLFLVVGLPIVLLATLSPGLLPMIEIWGITLLLGAVFDPVFNTVKTAAQLPGWTFCLYLLALFIVVERALYGPWLATFLCRDMKKNRAEFVVNGTPETLWRALVPAPEHAESYYWPKARFLAAPRGSHADCVLNLPRQRGYKDALLEIYVEEAIPHTNLRYRADPMLGSADPAHTVEFEITPLDDQTCQVSYTLQYLAVPLGKRLFYYLNHDFNDTLASLRARVSGRSDRSIHGLQMLSA